MPASKFAKPVTGLVTVRSVALILSAGFVLAGCGGGGTEEEISASANAAAPGTASDARTATALAVKGKALATWTKIADEGAGYMSLNGAPVRYGAGTKWVKRRVDGNFTCSAATFGSDPAPGATKTCEARDIVGIDNAKLSWTASGDPSVAGYRVYYGMGAGNYLQTEGAGAPAGNRTSFTIVGLETGKTYYFAVTSMNAGGNESDFSNEASTLVTN